MLYEAYLLVSQKSMANAANEIKQQQQQQPFIQTDSPIDCTISLDGSWQKRGFDSQNGLVTAIVRRSNVDKCIDYEIMTKKCKACQVWSSKKGTLEYNEWFIQHEMVCSVNHVGSSGSMESSGAIAIFSRSIQLYHLQYKTI